ncbi:MAG: hypothetical protein ACRDKE_10150 [Solirubrobacterales bacterium]
MRGFATSMVTLLAVLGCVPSSAHGSPPQVDPSILTIRSCATHRIIVERKCNPEHCRTDAFLQSGVGSAAIKIHPIREINEHVSAFVTEVNLDTGNAGCKFVLTVDEPHTGDRLFTLSVEPNHSEEGYAASKTQAPN